MFFYFYFIVNNLETEVYNTNKKLVIFDKIHFMFF